MRTKVHAKVKIDKDLMAEFGGCVDGKKYDHASIEVNDEQRQLLTELYAKRGCNRKKFAEIFKAKYGFGSVGTLPRICKREGIEIESGWSNERK